MTPMIDMQPSLFDRCERRSVRVSPRNIGWALLTVLTAVLWCSVWAMAAADLMRDPVYTYETEVVDFVSTEHFCGDSL